MIIVLPSDALILTMHGFASRYYPAVDWWMAYEHICRACIKYDCPTEILNATSSINNLNFNPCRKMDSPIERLAYLFKNFGQSGLQDYDKLLRRLKIRSWADLAKPIAIQGRRPKIFPCQEWFEMRGRTFKESPNSCHKDTVWVQGFYLRFCNQNKRWEAGIDYGSPHDCSSWDIKIYQGIGQSLDDFAEEINKTIDDKLIAESENDSRFRPHREDVWSEKKNAFEELFYDDYKAPQAITDLLVEKNISAFTTEKIKLNPHRVTTLKKWIQADKKERQKWIKEHSEKET